MTPRTFGNFVFEQELGHGGMSVVYHGHHKDLGYPVAIKVLEWRHAKKAEFISRFQREAEVTSSIQHPNIVRVIESGVEDDLFCIVMEYVKGKDLQAALRACQQARVTVPPWLALVLLHEVADGLRAAHAAGIIHRDIKPGNILLGATGEVKIGDFGLARPVMRVGSGHTIPGTVMGTVHYMSPEQWRGAPNIDERADVFSLGVVAYELLTGRRPFEGDDPFAIYNAISRVEHPSPKDSAPHVPDAVVSLIDSMLAKQPASRAQSMSGVQDAIDRCLDTIDTQQIIRHRREAIGKFVHDPVGYSSHLKRLFVERHLERGARLSSSGEMEAAILALHNVLWLDPGHQRAGDDLSMLERRVFASGVGPAGGAPMAAASGAGLAAVPPGETLIDDADPAPPRGGPAGAPPGAPPVLGAPLDEANTLLDPRAIALPPHPELSVGVAPADGAPGPPADVASQVADLSIPAFGSAAGAAAGMGDAPPPLEETADLDSAEFELIPASSYLRLVGLALVVVVAATLLWTQREWLSPERFASLFGSGREAAEIETGEATPGGSDGAAHAGTDGNGSDLPGDQPGDRDHAGGEDGGHAGDDGGRADASGEVDAADDGGGDAGEPGAGDTDDLAVATDRDGAAGEGEAPASDAPATDAPVTDADGESSGAVDRAGLGEGVVRPPLIPRQAKLRIVTTPPGARVSLRGPSGQSIAIGGVTPVETPALDPGAWRVFVELGDCVSKEVAATVTRGATGEVRIELDAALAMVEFMVVPDAEVFLDDRRVRSSARIGRIEVAACKPHKLRFQYGSFEYVRAFELQPGNTLDLGRIDFNQRGTIRVFCEPQGAAEVILNGKSSQQVTPFTMDVVAGTHDVVVRRTGYAISAVIISHESGSLEIPVGPDHDPLAPFEVNVPAGEEVFVQFRLHRQ